MSKIFQSRNSKEKVCGILKDSLKEECLKEDIYLEG